MQRSTLRDYDDRDIFNIFLLPGNNQKRKVVPFTYCLIISTLVTKLCQCGNHLMLEDNFTEKSLLRSL